jgi:UDP-glucose 4-epimerase
MRVLLLGGHGFIGSHTAGALKRLGHTIGVLDCHNQYDHYPDREYFAVLEQRVATAGADRIFAGRIEDAACLDAAFAEFRPHTVVHLATYPNARMVERDPIDASANMIDGTENVLRACAAHKVERLVFASSSLVYGDFRSAAPAETSPARPTTLYGRLKLRGEELCLRLGRRSGLEIVILRPSALYGPRDMIVRVISVMASSCVHHGRIVVQGRHSRLDFSFVDDVAEAFALAAIHPRAAGRVFNCTRGFGRTVLQAAEILRATLGHGTIELRESDDFYPPRGTLNSDRIKAELGWRPTVDIENGIPAYVKWLLAQEFMSRAKAPLQA